MSKFDFRKMFPRVEIVKLNPDKNVVNLNGRDYLVSIFLDNMSELYEIPTDKLMSLTLEDGMLGFVNTGTLTYKSPTYSTTKMLHKIIESTGGDCADKLLGPSDGIDNSFHFTGSGTELVHIKLQVMRSDQDDDKPERKDDLIMHTYAITNVSDSGKDFDNKHYTLEFVGIERYILEQYKLKDFSGGNSSRKIPDSEMPNDEHPIGGNSYKDKLTYKADKTGEAIYHIMLSAYNSWSTTTGCTVPFTDLLPPIRTEDSKNRQLTSSTSSSGGSPVALLDILGKSGSGEKHAVNYFINVGDQSDNTKEYIPSGGAPYSPPLKKPTDFWDFGAPDSCLFTHFGKTVSTWDVINSYRRMHTSGSVSVASPNSSINLNLHDPCILQMERPVVGGDQRGKISLRPLTSYFEAVYHDGRPSEGLMGNFTFNVTDNSDNTFERVSEKLRPILCDDVKTTDKSIDTFIFEPTIPQVASKFFKTHTTTYIKGGSTNTNAVDGDFDNVKQYIGVNYVSHIYENTLGVGQEWGDVVNIQNNGMSSDASNFRDHTYKNSPSISAQLAHGRNKAIQAFIFMNDALSFTIDGSINRKSGQVFTAAPPEGVEPTDRILNRINGSYLCSKIIHHFDFTNSKYTNDIMGVRFFK